jgi:glucans biosynthesis protein C
MQVNERINGFDAVRAVAMWLGVVLHSLIVYKATPAPNWPHDAGAGYVFLDWLYDFIHIFRMPLFYLVAGFFSRMVIAKKGLSYFINQRFQRIFIPFIVSVIVLLPLSLLPFHVYRFFYEEQLSWSVAWQKSSAQMLRWNGFAHLWFLYYLLFFYVTAIGIQLAISKAGVKSSEGVIRFIGSFTIIKAGIPVVILWALLQVFHIYTPPVYTGIKPNLVYILYYGLFFYWGWLMQINANSIFSMSRYAWVFMLTGIVLSITRFIWPNLLNGEVIYLVVAIETISLVAGFIGLFIRYFNTNSSRWRYFSDSSYWVYLIHLMLVSSMQVLLLHSVVPALLRMVFVMIVTFIIALASYHYFVRYSVIGRYLHGKREREQKK